MAARRIIEEEAGIWTGRRHRHDGYCAGDFSNTPFRPLAPRDIWNPTRPIVQARPVDQRKTAQPLRDSNGFVEPQP